jgi:hypothetical protein
MAIVVRWQQAKRRLRLFVRQFQVMLENPGIRGFGVI